MIEPITILEPIDKAIDHIRGAAAGHVILEYGDYECPYPRQAFREIERVERRVAGDVRFAFRHYPLTATHRHALVAAAAAEAAELRGRSWGDARVAVHQSAPEDDEPTTRRRC